MSSWDGVPWMVGGGAKHSVNVCRNVSHAAFNGRQGIVTPTDAEVRELAVPGTSVRVFPGTVAVRNRAVSAHDEMYVGRLPVSDTVAIAPTTPGGGRSDLIVVRVENPFEDGASWPQPSDPEAGPYIFTRVIPGVPSGTKTADELGLGHSMVALARIDIPASTATIQQSMITDLRELSAVYSQRDFDLYSPLTTETLNASSYVNFPAAAKITVNVPSWATHAKVRAFLAGAQYGNATDGAGNVYGFLRLALLGAATNIYGQATDFNLSIDSNNTDRATLMAGSPSMYINPANRGKAATIQLQAQKNGGDATFKTDHVSMVSLEVEWVRLTDTNV